MISLLQRVSEASVSVDGRAVAACKAGLLVFVAFEPHDDSPACERMAERILGYRVFGDAGGRMNLSVGDAGGEVLFVPQFTLAADTRKGTRPSFSGGADPGKAEALFQRLVDCASRRHPGVHAGRFGADMKVALVNDGPATFLLRSARRT